MASSTVLVGEQTRSQARTFMTLKDFNQMQLNLKSQLNIGGHGQMQSPSELMNIQAPSSPVVAHQMNKSETMHATFSPKSQQNIRVLRPKTGKVAMNHVKLRVDLSPSGDLGDTMKSKPGIHSIKNSKTNITQHR